MTYAAPLASSADKVQRKASHAVRNATPIPSFYFIYGAGTAVSRQLASHQGEHNSIPDGIALGLPPRGIVSDDTAGHVFSPALASPALCHIRLTSPSPALQTSLRAAHASPLRSFMSRESPRLHNACDSPQFTLSTWANSMAGISRYSYFSSTYRTVIGWPLNSSHFTGSIFNKKNCFSKLFNFSSGTTLGGTTSIESNTTRTWVGIDSEIMYFRLGIVVQSIHLPKKPFKWQVKNNCVTNFAGHMSLIAPLQIYAETFQPAALTVYYTTERSLDDIPASRAPNNNASHVERRDMQGRWWRHEVWIPGFPSLKVTVREGGDYVRDKSTAAQRNASCPTQSEFPKEDAFFDPYIIHWNDIALSVAEGWFTSRLRRLTVRPVSFRLLGWRLVQEDRASEFPKEVEACMDFQLPLTMLLGSDDYGSIFGFYNVFHNLSDISEYVLAQSEIRSRIEFRTTLVQPGITEQSLWRPRARIHVSLTAPAERRRRQTHYFRQRAAAHESAARQPVNAESAVVTPATILFAASSGNVNHPASQMTSWARGQEVRRGEVKMSILHNVEWRGKEVALPWQSVMHAESLYLLLVCIQQTTGKGNSRWSPTADDVDDSDDIQGGRKKNDKAGGFCMTSFKMAGIEPRVTIQPPGAAIVGFRTGKILFFGVKNKYSTTRVRVTTKGKTPSSHTRFQNWGENRSSSMEAALIVQGFCQNAMAQRLHIQQVGRHGVERRIYNLISFSLASCLPNMGGRLYLVFIVPYDWQWCGEMLMTRRVSERSVKFVLVFLKHPRQVAIKEGGEIPGKPADQRHCPARFPLVKIRVNRSGIEPVRYWTVRRLPMKKEIEETLYDLCLTMIYKGDNFEMKEQLREYSCLESELEICERLLGNLDYFPAKRKKKNKTRAIYGGEATLFKDTLNCRRFHCVVVEDIRNSWEARRLVTHRAAPHTTPAWVAVVQLDTSCSRATTRKPAIPTVRSPPTSSYFRIWNPERRKRYGRKCHVNQVRHRHYTPSSELTCGVLVLRDLAILLVETRYNENMDGKYPALASAAGWRRTEARQARHTLTYHEEYYRTARAQRTRSVICINGDWPGASQPAADPATPVDDRRPGQLQLLSPAHVHNIDSPVANKTVKCLVVNNEEREILEPTGGVKIAQKVRTKKLRRAYGKTYIYNEKCLSIHTKVRRYNIQPEALYASETLTVHRKDSRPEKKKNRRLIQTEIPKNNRNIVESRRRHQKKKIKILWTYPHAPNKTHLQNCDLHRTENHALGLADEELTNGKYCPENEVTTRQGRSGLKKGRKSTQK
ncbi:hypothetical protein PR048_018371 [Dryococelus australis]|uniref:Mutator-like transposase domain-containing protein n=1 Tax=Dryococelus australis TaxID=614101 RepID=A0ABQ9HC85_9NEOP|nr:hypothetical protein PR048_018371 [Dryococelus australis]